MDIETIIKRREKGEKLKDIVPADKLNAIRQKLYRHRKKMKKQNPIMINYTQIINHVRRKIKMQDDEVDPKLLKIMKECEGPKQRQKRLVMDVIDQINEILK